MTLVLLVDDDPLIVDIVSATLGNAGYTVGVMTDGRGVLEVVEFKRPALVILDCMMPEVPGMEVLRQLRLSPKTSTIPVLMLTARDSPSDREIALRAGATGYLAKPFDPARLKDRVDRMIHDSEAPADFVGARLASQRG